MEKRVNYAVVFVVVVLVVFAVLAFVNSEIYFGPRTSSGGSAGVGVPSANNNE